MINEILYLLLPYYHEVPPTLPEAIMSNKHLLKANPQYTNKIVAPTMKSENLNFDINVSLLIWPIWVSRFASTNKN